MTFSTLFTSPAIIGMIHVDALAGTPLHQYSPQEIIDRAVTEAELYASCGIHGIAIENMHDIPYLNGTVGPEITALMTAIGREIKRAVNIPCGIQILAGANREAMAAALAAGLDFVRAEGFVFAHVADEGIIESNAGDLLRYRKQIGAEHIPVFTDIKKKHSAHAITADVSLEETAHAAEFFLSDGLIITGVATGQEADLSEIQRVKNAVSLPVMVGSGVNLQNVDRYLQLCDGLIIGSWFKQNGHWMNPVDGERVKQMMEKVMKR
ncbi:MAG: BtpA/SgcQ family protein [Bacteroidota bacterium]